MTIKHKTYQLPDTITIFRFTNNSFKKIYPEISETTWENIMTPVNLMTYIRHTLASISESGNAIPPKKLRIVTMGEDYIKWLDDNAVKDSSDTRVQYACALNDADIIRLARENSYDRVLSLCCLLIVVKSKNGIMPAQTSFKLSDEQTATIVGKLSEVFGTDKIFVPGIVTTLPALISRMPQFEAMSQTYFDTGKKIRLMAWEEQNVGHEDIEMTLTIPFAIDARFDGSVLDLEKFFVQLMNADNTVTSVVPGLWNIADDILPSLLPENVFGDDYVVKALRHITWQEDLPSVDLAIKKTKKKILNTFFKKTADSV